MPDGYNRPNTPPAVLPEVREPSPIRHPVESVRLPVLRNLWACRRRRCCEVLCAAAAAEALAEVDTEALAEVDTEALAEVDTEALAEVDTEALAEVDTEALAEPEAPAPPEPEAPAPPEPEAPAPPTSDPSRRVSTGTEIAYGELVLLADVMECKLSDYRKEMAEIERLLAGVKAAIEGFKRYYSTDSFERTVPEWRALLWQQKLDVE